MGILSAMDFATCLMIRQRYRWFLLFSLFLSCSRPLPWSEKETRLPAEFRTPQATFHTWVQASLARDEEKVKSCYWQEMSPEELSAWLGENLSPQAVRFFQGMELVRLEPVTLVEVNFYYRNAEGFEGRGVMVKTRQGWKIQKF